MVKVDIIPIRQGVAGSTVCAKATVVFVILLVAGITIRGRSLKHAVLMAFFASDISMFAFQLEVRKVVIEGGILPIVWRVAGTAIHAKLPIVRVVSAMARITISRRVLEISQAACVYVAKNTLNALMPTGQLKLRDIVVVEAFTENVYTIMTIQAGCAIRQEMCLSKDGVHLTVAGVACI